MKMRKKIESIAYLRALAVAMILYDHLGGMRGNGWIVKRIVDFFVCTPLHIIQEFGAFGVSLFYLITGFLFLHTNKGRENCVRYYMRKMLKLYCYVMFSFAVFGVFQWMFHFVSPSYWMQFSLRDWVGCATLFYYFNGTGDIINGTTWFLLPLFAFYFLASCCHFMFRKHALQGVCMMEGILLLCVLMSAFLQSQEAAASLIPYMPFVYIPVAGLILYVILQKEIQAWQGIGMAVLHYGVMTAAFYMLNPQYYAQEPYLISVVYAIGLLICCISGENFFKSNRFVDFIGNISLSVYLVHMTWGGLLMSFFEARIRFTAAFAVSVLLIIIVAAVHHRAIEKGVLEKIIGSSGIYS